MKIVVVRALPLWDSMLMVDNDSDFDESNVAMLRN